MAKTDYDFFVIGCGPAGQSLAEAAAEAGHSVGITEARTYGGTCPNRGCDPKKVLYAAAQAVTAGRRLEGKGIESAPKANWKDLQDWKRTFTEPIPRETKTQLTGMGIDCFEGKTRFTGPNELSIGGRTVNAGRVIIATGAKPAPLDIPGKEYYLDSSGFLDMDDLPKRIVIIGSGYIGSSFAQISAMLGADVTVIASAGNPVENFDEDLSDMVARAAKEHGISFHFNTTAQKIERRHNDTLILTCEKDDGEEVCIETDRVIHCAGRVPNIDDLNLEAAGIEYGKEGISVDKQLNTTARDHYAIGDCADSGLPLTPVATYEASLLADNLFKGKDREIDYLPIPTVAFTLPPIASVGMSATQAKEDKRKLKINFADTTNWFTNRRLNVSAAGYKIIIDETEDLILGAHLLGPHAEEVINLFALAIREKITTTRLRHCVLTYPSATADIKRMIS